MGTTMTENADNRTARRWSPLKIAAWVAPALFMLVNLLAMRFTDEVNWTVRDFIFAGVVLYGALGAYEGIARMTGNTAYRAGVGVGIAALVLLLWGNGALGITDTDADGMYTLVVAIGVTGTFVAQVRPAGRTRALAMMGVMLATALALVLVSFGTLVGGMIGPHNSAIQIMGITGFYAVLFVGSALLFRESSRVDAERAAV